MKKMHTYIGVGVVIVAFLIGGWYAVSKQISNTDAPDTGPTYAKKEPTNGRSTLRDMLAAGVSQSCTFRSETEGQVSTGVVYISGGKMRGDFETTREVTRGVVETSHMISDGVEMKTWLEGAKEGFSMSLTEQSPADTSASKPPVGLDAQTDYACTTWIPDQTRFIPPSNVTFLSMTDLMHGAVPSAEVAPAPNREAVPTAPPTLSKEMKAMQCAACGQISDPAGQVQCKTALSCE